MSEQAIAVKPASICEFIDGEKDAQKGVQADMSRSKSYLMGYDFNYQMTEIMGNRK